jgi:LacI family transcriptional regulator
MAREAVRLLIDQIRKRRDGEAGAVRHELLKFTLIERESTAAPRNPAAAKPGMKSKVGIPKS